MVAKQKRQHTTSSIKIRLSLIFALLRRVGAMDAVGQCRFNSFTGRGKHAIIKIVAYSDVMILLCSHFGTVRAAPRYSRAPGPAGAAGDLSAKMLENYYILKKNKENPPRIVFTNIAKRFIIEILSIGDVIILQYARFGIFTPNERMLTGKRLRRGM